jgi:diaminopimelate epimerase
MRFTKGHGTENDFLVVPDPDGSLDLTARLVAALCDRRAGIGADGVLRVVRTAAVTPGRGPAGPGDPGAADGSEWFMDYRNADGSIAEMCGNGVRVFARYLAVAGLVKPDQPLPVGTRGGVRTVWFEDDGQLTVDMGVARFPASLAQLRVRVDVHREWHAVGVTVPNPHAVVFVGSLDDAGDLRSAPRVTPNGVLPDGVNVEFVVDHGRETWGPEAGVDRLALRVYERGVGETRSCGTGVCAAAVAARRRGGSEVAAPSTYRVDVPGGRLTVALDPDGRIRLTGPAVLVAEGDVEAEWVAVHR